LKKAVSVLHGGGLLGVRAETELTRPRYCQLRGGLVEQAGLLSTLDRQEKYPS
jgi:hypothetical protein